MKKLLSPFLYRITILSIVMASIESPVFAQQAGIKDAGIDFFRGAVCLFSSISMQNDGKVIAGFGVLDGVNNIYYIARLNSDGTIDTTFSAGTGTNARVYGIAQQSDRKIIIGGEFTYYNNNNINRIGRLNSNGSLDATFNAGAGANERVEAISVQKDGKIIIGGYFNYYNGTNMSRLVRLNADGSVDNSFKAGAGLKEIMVQDIAVQADGKIIIGGGFVAYHDGYGLARFNSDGTPDNAFNDGKFKKVSVSAIALQSDGKIIACGSFTTYDGKVINGAVRFNSNGTLDDTFDPGTGTGGNGNITSIALQDDGGIIIGGYFRSYNGIDRSGIARLFPDGSLDIEFNPGLGINSNVDCIAIQEDGKIIVTGYFSNSERTPRRIIRLNKDGSIDNTFTFETKENCDALNILRNRGASPKKGIAIKSDFDYRPRFPGDAITVGLEEAMLFESFNKFTVQLSDEFGNFNKPVVLSELKSPVFGNEKVILPQKIKPGSTYKIRVLSSAPAFTSNDSYSFKILPLTIDTLPFYLSVSDSDKYKLATIPEYKFELRKYEILPLDTLNPNQMKYVWFEYSYRRYITWPNDIGLVASWSPDGKPLSSGFFTNSNLQEKLKAIQKYPDATSIFWASGSNFPQPRSQYINEAAGFFGGLWKYHPLYSNEILYEFYSPAGVIKERTYNEADGERQVTYLPNNCTAQLLKHPNGNIRAKGANNGSGYMTGEWTYYHENGKILSEGMYENGTPQGQWTTYNEEGQIKTKGYFNNGKETGTWYYYYDNGNIKSTGEFYERQKKGEWKYYNVNGELVRTEFYKENAMIVDNKVINAINKRGEKCGEWITWYDNGQIEKKTDHWRGSEYGKFEEWYSNGQLKSRGRMGLGNLQFHFYSKNKNRYGRAKPSHPNPLQGFKKTRRHQPFIVRVPKGIVLLCAWPVLETIRLAGLWRIGRISFDMVPKGKYECYTESGEDKSKESKKSWREPLISVSQWSPPSSHRNIAW